MNDSVVTADAVTDLSDDLTMVDSTVVSDAVAATDASLDAERDSPDVNQPPTIATTCTTFALSGLHYGCQPTATDPEDDAIQDWEFDPASHSCDWMEIDSSTGAISGVPGISDSGFCTLAFSVSDSKGARSAVVTEQVMVLAGG